MRQITVRHIDEKINVPYSLIVYPLYNRIFKVLKEKGTGFCHCGLKESWKAHRLCLTHRNQLQNQLESRVQYYEINGQRQGSTDTIWIVLPVENRKKLIISL